MIKRSHFTSRFLAYLLITPQILVTLTFFYWPAAQGLLQSVMLSDPFGQRNRFVWFDNFIDIFTDPLYLKSVGITLVFSFAVAVLAILTGLLIATMANRALIAKTPIRTLLIWPYAVAPAISGILWLFLLHPSFGVVAIFIKRRLGIDWNPVLNGTDAFIMVVLASAWKQISYNFVFFMAGLQAVPHSLIEAAAMDGAGPFRRFWAITLPLLSPTLVLSHGHEYHLRFFRNLRCDPHGNPGRTRRRHHHAGLQSLPGWLHRFESGLFRSPVGGVDGADCHHHGAAVPIRGTQGSVHGVTPWLNAPRFSTP